MVLATTGADGPDARVVLCKAIDHGLVFHTNRASRKGQQLEAHPTAAAVFHWPALERQIRVLGAVTRVSDDESDAYFAYRPRGSQLGAWASDQSQPVQDQATLRAAADAAATRFDPGPVPRPPGWGGYRLIPTQIELWQGGPDRLHDRLEATRAADGSWTWGRLQP